MKAGIVIPQGLTGEYEGWEPQRAWARSVQVAQQAERLGFESIWAYDHFHTMPEPTDQPTFESFVFLTGLASQTTSVRLGQLVMCSAFRNPALAAKMLSTLDVVSSGRAELGIGAGWKQDEWEAYGYGFPTTSERLAILTDGLEVITRMLGPARATYVGQHAVVHGAINEPLGLQRPRIPIMVGGNGPMVTWRLAARLADELNLDGMMPDEVAQALPVIARRCEEVGRAPSSLRVSANIWEENVARPGSERVELLSKYRELELARVQCLIRASAESDDALESFAEDAQAAGLNLAS